MKQQSSGNRLADKVALITGAASGIGKATAVLFAAEGAKVAVTDLQEAGAQEVVGAITESGGKALSRKLDVTRETEWHATLADVGEHWGRLDILVACAGISFAKPVTEMTIEEWRRVMEANLDGVFLGVKHAVRLMREGSGSGSIVIVSSASGIKASPGASAYCASKAALRLFAKTVALEC